MRVIASSLRKGNIVEYDGKLYVVLNAESFHPGKGTPTTQVDMRRISDGVKIAQRFKTTEQVERAYVEDREHQYLYQDGDGYHFMNTENYDQVTLPADASFSLEAKTDLGSVTTNLPLLQKQHTKASGQVGNGPYPRLRAKTDLGSVRVHRG